MRLIHCFIVVSVFLIGAPCHAELNFSEVSGHGGVPLLVAESGNTTGPGVLFIHGLGYSHLAFLAQLESELAGQLHLVAFDLRGHGGSGKPWTEEDYQSSEVWANDVNAVMSEMNLERPVIVAWSFGANIAMDYLRHYGSDKVSGLNIIGSSAGLIAPSAPPDSDATREMFASLLERRRRSMALNLRDNLSAARETSEFFSYAGIQPTDERHGFIAQLLLPAYARRAMLTRNLDNRDLADSLDIPVLLTRGTDDIVMPAAAALELAKLLPVARLSEYPDAAHLPFAQQAARFNAELRRFVDETSNHLKASPNR